MEWPEITKDTPLEEVKRIHQEIWNYVIVFGHKPDTPYPSDCAACAYCYAKDPDLKSVGPCFDLCPIAWEKEDIKYPSHTYYICGKEFYQWMGATSYNEAMKAAIKIRDIPFKFEKESKTDD